MAINSHPFFSKGQVVDFLSHPLLQSLKLVDLPPYLIKSSIFGEWKEEGPI
jgi:hypothetical protein